MHQYPELMKVAASAERFYNEFKAVLPQDKFFTDHIFVEYCDDFQYAYHKYLRQSQSSAYKVNSLIRSYFYDNRGHVKRLALFAIFVNEFLLETEEILLDREYYELMHRFNDSKSKMSLLISAMMSDSL